MDEKSSCGQVSTAVIDAVATELNVEPDELPEPLYSVVDPEALDMLFARQNTADGLIRFSYCGYQVTVESSGEVMIDD